jgi:hypothetical protein
MQQAVGLLIPCRLQVGNYILNDLRGLAGKNTDDVIFTDRFAINYN